MIKTYKHVAHDLTNSDENEQYLRNDTPKKTQMIHAGEKKFTC